MFPLLSVPAPIQLLIHRFLPVPLRLLVLSHLCRALPSSHSDALFLRTAYRDARFVLTEGRAQLALRERDGHFSRSVLPSMEWLQCIAYANTGSYTAATPIDCSGELVRLMNELPSTSGLLTSLHTLCIGLAVPVDDWHVSFCRTAPSCCPSLTHLLLYRCTGVQDSRPPLPPTLCAGLSTCHWPSLRRLTVCGALLTSAVLAALCTIPHLTELNLDSCHLDDGEQAQTAAERRFSITRLSSSSWKQLLLPETAGRSRDTMRSLVEQLVLGPTSQLSYLLYQGAITSSSFKQIAKLSSLTALDLSRCRDWTATIDLSALLVPSLGAVRRNSGNDSVSEQSDKAESTSHSALRQHQQYQPALPNLRRFASLSWRVSCPSAAVSSTPASIQTELDWEFIGGKIGDILLAFVSTYRAQLSCLQLDVPDDPLRWQPVLSAVQHGARSLRSLALMGYKQPQKPHSQHHINPPSAFAQQMRAELVLHTLTLSGLSNMDSGAVMDVVRQCSRSLEDVHLSMLPLVSPLAVLYSMAALPSGCPRLRRLQFDQCNHSTWASKWMAADSSSTHNRTAPTTLPQQQQCPDLSAPFPSLCVLVVAHRQETKLAGLRYLRYVGVAPCHSTCLTVLVQLLARAPLQYVLLELDLSQRQCVSVFAPWLHLHALLVGGWMEANHSIVTKEKEAETRAAFEVDELRSLRPLHRRPALLADEVAEQQAEMDRQFLHERALHKCFLYAQCTDGDRGASRGRWTATLKTKYHFTDFSFDC